MILDFRSNDSFSVKTGSRLQEWSFDAEYPSYPRLCSVSLIPVKSQLPVLSAETGSKPEVDEIGRDYAQMNVYNRFSSTISSFKLICFV